MSTLIPPSPPESEDRHDAKALEALIEEARRRARRRRRGYAALALVAVAAGVLGFSVLEQRRRHRYCRGRRRGRRSGHRRQVAACARPGGRNHHGARRRPPASGHRLRSDSPGRRLQERGRWSHVAIAESPVPVGPGGRDRDRARGPGDAVCRHRARRGQDDGRGSFLAVDGLGSSRRENEGRDLLARLGGLRLHAPRRSARSGHRLRRHLEPRPAQVHEWRCELATHRARGGEHARLRPAGPGHALRRGGRRSNPILGRDGKGVGRCRPGSGRRLQEQRPRRELGSRWPAGHDRACAGARPGASGDDVRRFARQHQGRRHRFQRHPEDDGRRRELARRGPQRSVDHRADAGSEQHRHRLRNDVVGGRRLQERGRGPQPQLANHRRRFVSGGPAPSSQPPSRSTPATLRRSTSPRAPTSPPARGLASRRASTAAAAGDRRTRV